MTRLAGRRDHRARGAEVAEARPAARRSVISRGKTSGHAMIADGGLCVAATLSRRTGANYCAREFLKLPTRRTR
jgi:hypothetical protein